VRSPAGMKERLEAVGRKIGLKFMAAPVHGCFYLSTEMFYVEINIEGDKQQGHHGGNASSVKVTEAKVHHIDSSASSQQTTQNCPEIMDCLSKSDFIEFVKHLKGLVAAYDLGATATQAQKARAWTALQLAEADLGQIDAIAAWPTTFPLTRIHTGPLGLLTPRRGGLPMKIRFFLPTRHLVDPATNKIREATAETISEHELGLSGTVVLERTPERTKEGGGGHNEEESLLNRMQTVGLIGRDGAGMDFAKDSSDLLPARLALQLDAPMPLTLANCRRLTALSRAYADADASEALGSDAFFDADESKPLLTLIAEEKIKKDLADGKQQPQQHASAKGLFVTLPDQLHCYYLSDPPGESSEAVLVRRVPFAHPASVPAIVAVLREQAAFNEIIASCVRARSQQDVEKSVMLEVSFTDLRHVSVTFEHPLVPAAMVLMDVDLTNPAEPSCSVDLPEIPADTLEEGEEKGPLIKPAIVSKVMKK